jgi:hypothetical protein
LKSFDSFQYFDITLQVEEPLILSWIWWIKWVIGPGIICQKKRKSGAFIWEKSITMDLIEVKSSFGYERANDGGFFHLPITLGQPQISPLHYNHKPTSCKRKLTLL